MIVGKSKFNEIVSRSYIPVVRSYDIKQLAIATNAIRQKIADYIDDVSSNKGYSYYLQDMNGQAQSSTWIEKEFMSEEVHSVILANIETIIYDYLVENNLLDRKIVSEL